MRPRERLQAGISVVAVAAVAVHHLWPGFRADAFTGTFLVVAVLPWLAPVLKSIKLPGGFEVELRELREELEQTKGAVESAARQAQIGAVSVTVPALIAAGSGLEEASGPRDRLLALGSEYETVRRGMPSGAARTEAMTRVLAEMLRVAQDVPEMNIRESILTRSPGSRLAAIAYAHEHPGRVSPEPLVLALGDVEDTPFGQYWILRALRRIATVDRAALFGPLAQRIASYKGRQQRGTDRYYEATQLLREIGYFDGEGDDPYGF